MAVEGSFQGLGLTITVNDPLVWADRALSESLAEQVSAYGHEIQALGGYWSASFTVSDMQEKLEEWIIRGIGRHVIVHDENLMVAWEGFVNQVALTSGPFSITRGPLMDVGNRVQLAYSTIDTTTSPPTMGMRATTGLANDTSSQTTYGIIQKTLSSGGIATAMATQVRDTYIAENALPQTSQAVSLGAGTQPNIVVDCLGYVHWLAAYPYNQIAFTGTQNLSTKIENILDADPNSFFASTNADITANALQVRRYESKDRIAWNIVKELVAKGDVSDNRYLFGIYADRRAVYAAAPTTVGYVMRLRDPEQKIETREGQRVRPWTVLPGRWLLIPDAFVGRTVPAALRSDPRAIFIESVRFSAPAGLDVEGAKVGTLSQKLAKLGLSGIGA